MCWLRQDLLVSYFIFILVVLLTSKSEPELVQYFEVSENLPPNTRIGFIDADRPPYLIVPIPGSAIDSDLIIDQITGEIKTKIPLDRESRSSYSLVVLPQNIHIIVKVHDENDNVPSFIVKNIDVEFPENSPRDSKRALPPAKDPDIGQYSTQGYDIVSGNHGDTFRLVSHRGRDGVLYLDLQTSGILDREAWPSYQLLVEATDGGSPPLCSHLQVKVIVQDVNDNPPIFEKSRYIISVSENTTVGTSVLTVRAMDADIGTNGCIEYSINRRQSDREEIFHVDPEKGLIYLNKPLDFESKERHDLVLVARDKGEQPLEATVFVSVHVSDINDNQPTITVIFLSDDATPKISESAQPGEFVARISISDPDLRTEYSNTNVRLSGGDGHFGLAIHHNIIYLVVTEQELDREEKSSYEITLEVMDAGTPPLRALCSFILLITDVNDNAPKFFKKYYEVDLLEMSEPGASVIEINAIDVDEGINSRVKYSILNSTLFTINEDSGLITIKSYVDCENDPKPIFVVVAYDCGKPVKSSSATVQVRVHDVYNNEPVFDKPLYNLTVLEDIPLGSCLIQVPDLYCLIQIIILCPVKRHQD